MAFVSIIAAARLMADCSPAVAVQVPVAACKSGTATAAVLGLPGASYAWTVDGGTIVGDATGDHIVITLGTSVKAVVSVTMTTAGCVAHGAGLITLRAPFDVHVAAIPASRANEPLTISWSYDNGTPAQQTISGDFGTVSLPSTARSYSYTPQTSGNKQFVIDATLAGTAAGPAPATRQRAVSKSPVTASTCSAAHTAVPYTVDACMTPPVIVDGPSSVVSGTAFQLAVRSQPGAVATWTITNGLPASATGDSVTITPGASGSVDVNVDLTRGACVGRLSQSVAITPKPDCDNPKVSVSTGPLSCGSAIVNASFTGTPPFQGKWSDGFLFNTSATSVVRTVTIPGNYSIVDFQDATCSGPSSNVAVVPALIPTATIIAGFNSCATVGTFSARFTGKPPFSGCWNDGSCFQTNQTEISKLVTMEGTNTLSYGTDATGCPLSITGSVQGLQTPRVQLTHSCEWAPGYPNTAVLVVKFSGYFSLPTEVTWSDGVKTYGTRYVTPAQTTTYTIAGVGPHVSTCPVVFDYPQSYTVYPNPVPDFTIGTGDLCKGATATASLNTPPPPGTQVTWVVQGGSLLSGQGTNSIQYQAGSGIGVNGVNVLCTFTFADPGRCPLTDQRTRRVVDPIADGTLLLSSTPIHAGNTLEIHFGLGYTASSWSITNSLNDPITLTAPCVLDPNQGTTCYALYTSTHGPGTSTITLHVSTPCHTEDFPASFTILP